MQENQQNLLSQPKNRGPVIILASNLAFLVDDWECDVHGSHQHSQQKGAWAATRLQETLVSYGETQPRYVDHGQGNSGCFCLLATVIQALPDTAAVVLFT